MKKAKPSRLRKGPGCRRRYPAHHRHHRPYERHRDHRIDEHHPARAMEAGALLNGERNKAEDDAKRARDDV
jgi:hypothetical protein